MTKLSIIVPVYNVEDFILPCFESIFKQGLCDDEYEVIIVNDGSTDNSMEMIEDIISQHNNVTIINQENQSLSVARNNGIQKAKGEYIYMPDSDDVLIENSLSSLLELALESKVDLLVADFLKMSDNEIKSYIHTQLSKITVMKKTGEQLFIEDLNPHHCYVWRTLYKREFLLDNHISFIPGINYQDIPFTHECCLKAKQCIKTSQLLYIYRFDRPGAASSSFSIQKARSYCVAIGNTWKLRHLPNLSPKARYKIEENVYCSFCIMMYKASFSITNLSERRQIISLLNQEAPGIHFSHGIRQRFLTFMIKKIPYTYVELYYIFSQIKYKKVPFIPFFSNYMHKENTQYSLR